MLFLSYSEILFTSRSREDVRVPDPDHFIHPSSGDNVRPVAVVKGVHSLWDGNTTNWPEHKMGIECNNMSL